mmetsp:Transcript_30972/g.40893  ORF Transcript_30972/g.40893 Transcript_30972/m.40893 type:complete len:145 (-) Transcript_30972:2855-3289(-)
MALKGGVFSISGTLSSSRSEYFKYIKKNGGKTASSVTNSVTHLICSEDEYNSKSNKVRAAKEKNVWLVCEEYVDQCIFAGELIELTGTEGEFLWDPAEEAEEQSSGANRKSKGDGRGKKGGGGAKKKWKSWKQEERGTKGGGRR